MKKRITLKRVGIAAVMASGLCTAGLAAEYLSSKTVATAESTKPTDVTTSSHKYLLVGKSAFNAEGDNIYRQGGELRSFETTVEFDDAAGKVKIDGFATGTAYEQICNPAVLDWDKENNTIKANTPDSFREASNAVCLVEFEGGALTFNAGEMYGAGYWRTFSEMEMSVNDDLSVIHPNSAYAITENFYDSRDESYSRSGLAAVMFDVNMYRMGEGPLVYSSAPVVDFDRCYVGETTQQTILLVNSGSEDADYAVTSSNDCVAVSQKYGVIPSGEWVELTITFSPDEVKEFNETVTVIGEQNVAKINVIGSGQDKPDYSSIVKEGSEELTFNTSNDYPFVISEEYGSNPVAVTTNKTVANSESWIDVTFTVPEGKRGQLSYEGYFYPRYAVYDTFFIKDGNKLLFETDDDRQYYSSLASTLSFIPGTHTVRFCYEKGNQPNVPSVTMGEDYVYLSSLSLEFTDYLANDCELDSDFCTFGKLYTMDEAQLAGTTKENAFALKNTGYENLIISGITNSTHFTASIQSSEIAPDRTAGINISFAAKEAAEYNEDIVIKTSAGDVTLHCHANLLAAPDYQSVVKEGTFKFEMGKIPFIVDNGKMFNNPEEAVAGEKVVSEISARFNVPEGKIGLLTWDGYADCGDGDEGMIMIDQNIFQMLRFAAPGYAGSYSAKPTQCWLAPGEHLISFGYTSCGSSEFEGNNELCISDLSLKIYDEIPAAVIWEEMPVKLNPMYPGYTVKRALTLWNMDYTKQRITKVESVDCPEGFSCDFDPENELTINPLSARDLIISFTPEKAGIYEGEIVIHTDCGDVTAQVYGEGKDDSDLVFYEDFENGIDKWTTTDVNGDDNTWKVAPASMAHIGSGALQFNTFFASGDSEDYIVSPEMIIPEGGATLSFFRAYNANNAAHEYYVAVGTGDDPSTFEKVFSEDEFSREYQEMNVNLDAYAGKTVKLCFANVTPDGKNNILKIDEVSVIGKKADGINTISVSKPGATEYFTISGNKTANPGNGIFIVKEKNSDGTMRVTKKVIK